MALLNLLWPHILTIEKIDEVVTEKSAGYYALGYAPDGLFVVRYVGRSDNDVNDRLKKWVEKTKLESWKLWSGKGKKYTHFVFGYAASAKEAFEQECRNYHHFGGSEKLDNEKHPERPYLANWKCPECDIFD